MNRRGFLRALAAAPVVVAGTKAAGISIGNTATNGFLTPNEMRDALGLAPIDSDGFLLPRRSDAEHHRTS